MFIMFWLLVVCFTHFAPWMLAHASQMHIRCTFDAHTLTLDMFCIHLDMEKWVKSVWLATRLTRDPFDPRPVWPDTRTRLNTPCPFCHVYQHWVDWDWGVIFIKYLLILLYLICYVLHYSLSFFTCHLHFLFLL